RPREPGRRGLSADHADLQGIGQRGGASPADRLHQVAPARGGDERREPARRPGEHVPGSSRRGRMNTTQTADSGLNYLNADYGVRSWLLTRDHKRIALLYLITITVMFAIGGIAALLVRLDLLTPAGDLMGDDTYNKMFTAHGVVMIFFFLIPSIPAVL